MLELFRKDRPIGYVLLCIYVLLLRIPAFISETNWTPLARSPFSDLVYNAIGYTSITAHIVGTILIFFQAIIINSMMNSNRITKESSLFPGLLFILLQTLIPDFNYLSPAMMANTFLVMALWNISTSYKKTGKSGEIFNTGIFIGIAMLFDISYFVFLVCGFVGWITSWSCDNEVEILDKVFEIPGSRRFGEAAIGTNYRIDRLTKNILYDEKIGGTIHMAVGQSYLQAGGKNESALHWDMISDMTSGGQIYADGKLIYENGKFL